MEFKRNLDNLGNPAGGCVATIGNFDGVHLGHRKILDTLVGEGRGRNLPSAVICFEPTPKEFFKGEEAPVRLTRFREKYVLLRDCGIDYLVCLRFNKKFAAISAADFIDRILYRGVQAKLVLVGDDFHFGKDRRGNFKMLQEAGAGCGFQVMSTATVEHEGARISSSRVRQALAGGRIEEARALLGRPFSMSGRVGYGDGIGRQLGFPTANVLTGRPTLPLHGVFSVRVTIEPGRRLYGAASAGTRPTIDGTREVLEVHIFDVNENLYGKLVRVEFLERLRDELRYESLEALRAQIGKDVEQARASVARYENLTS
ncbi:MAG: bifunctional riboflavin kinase/FAD synthetase [Gammaproteobacteria bacterium]|nr:bifunctional riboflavin kinase/FAD synthetase [Gammaproteobacteria bacterium]